MHTIKIDDSAYDKLKAFIENHNKHNVTKLEITGLVTHIINRTDFAQFLEK